MLSRSYPTLEQVEEAYPHELQQWQDELPIAQSEEDKAVLDRIFERYHDTLNNHNW